MNHSILVELARALTKEDFVARLPDPVLIVMSEMQPEEASGDDDTQVGEQSGRPAGVRSNVPATFEALPVRKKRHAENKSHITLGRERTCDIVVRTPGVSKLHAHFVTEPTLLVVDRGSQNGTFVDGKRLTADHPVEVKPGALLVFGDLTCRLVSPAELYGLLKSGKS
jgi:pSer/pThr/pTyr-binding forkhead associated (FHA) protein